MGRETVTIETSATAAKHLDELVATGLFGRSREEAAERLLCEGIRAHVGFTSRADFSGQIPKAASLLQAEALRPAPSPTSAETDARAADAAATKGLGSPAAEAEQVGAAPSEPPGEPALPALPAPPPAPVVHVCHDCGFKTKAGLWVDGPGEDRVWRCSSCTVTPKPKPAPPAAVARSRVCPYCQKPVHRGTCAARNAAKRAQDPAAAR